MNQEPLRRLIGAMYAVSDFPALDEYGSKIFGRPVKNTWRLFRYITKTAIADIWKWNPGLEQAGYPKIEVSDFEEFSTFMFHEAAHGWCYFLKDDLSSQNYPTGADEERVCWDVSQLVCEMLGISYRKDLADLSYQFHLHHTVRADDIDGIGELFERLPTHARL